MVLVLQTNISGSLLVWLVNRGQLVAYKKKSVEWHGSEKLLPTIDAILHAQKRQLKHINRIIVVRGPGPFTAVRSGIVTANTLGWLLNVPVQGLVSDVELSTVQVLTAANRNISKKFVAVKPAYGREPNISAPKKKTLR